MKTKAERRLTKRLCQENAQIFADSAAEDHPLHIFARDELVLILEFRDLMETFEFEFPRILKQIHDFYVVTEIFHIQSTEDGADDDVREGFRQGTMVASIVFDQVTHTEMVTTGCREMINNFRYKLTGMKQMPYMNETLQFSREKNQFKNVDYWKRKFVTTLRTRNQLAKQPVGGYTYSRGLPVLKYCYGIDGGDPWTKLRLPGRY